MADQSLIEWTDATWNPITGCTMVDAGCTNCYAMGLAGTRLNSHPSRAGLTRQSGGRHIWTGEVRLNEQWLDQPLRWSKPRMIFVCAHGDLFHEAVPDEWIDRVFEVMQRAYRHTFQVLTKRPERARDYLKRFMPVVCPTARVLTGGHRYFRVEAEGPPEPSYVTRDGQQANRRDKGSPLFFFRRWPLPNVWLGTSISDQASADARVAHLLDAPAAVRFLSAEPLLGPVDLHRIPHHKIAANITIAQNALTGINGLCETGPHLDWVIVGGESGKNARPMHPDWARDLRDQCHAEGVAFFFKQWGQWHPRRQAELGDLVDANKALIVSPNGRTTSGLMPYHPKAWLMDRLTKAAAGRLLDGREWNQMPKGCTA